MSKVLQLHKELLTLLWSSQQLQNGLKMGFLRYGWAVLGVAELSGQGQTFALTLSGSRLESQGAAALRVRPGLLCWRFLPLDLVLDRGAQPRHPDPGQELWPCGFPVVPCA